MINSKNKRTLIFMVLVWILAGFASVSIALEGNHEKELAAQNVATKDSETSQQQNIFKSLEIFNQTLMYLQSKYVDELDYEKLIDAAIEGMLKELDPHTNYFRPDDFKDFMTSTEGEFGGLGISISKQDDYITVVSPIEGTPAYKMGIMAGDKIVKVDGEDVVGLATDKVIKKMRGEKGTKVVITIKRPGIKDLLDFEIIRDIIKIKAVPYAFKFDNGVGYVRLRQFNAHTADELREALDKLEKDGMKGLIIDLRSNPGGLLGEAVDTVNEFIGKGKRVVFTKGRTESGNSTYFTKYDRKRADYPLICLIDGASASASEIFAGTIQDYDRGLVLGTPSFGKGSVQQLFPLPDNHGIKITVAKYYINSGRCIHKDLNDKLLKGEKISDEEKKKIEEENHKIEYHTESGRVVYGGGGIIPDIEVKPDLLTKFGVELRRKNLFFKYTVDYLTKHSDEVTHEWKADEKIMKDFLQYAEKDSIKYTQADVDSISGWIQHNLTSNMISRKYGELEGYKVSTVEDKQLQEAIKILEKFDTIQEIFDYANSLKKEDESESE